MRHRGIAAAAAVAVAALSLVGAERARAEPDPRRPTCAGTELCVGAAKVAVSPDAATVAGVLETRLEVGPRLQRFHLGGYGINPLQGLPDPDGSVAAALTEPAAKPVFVGSKGPEPIWVRAMAITQPGGETVLFVTLDAIGAGNVIQERLTAAVSAATGVPAADVVFGQTHSHAGPDLQGLWGGVPQRWIEEVLYPGAVRAARDALARSEPARLEVRSGELDAYDRYRRPRRLDPDEEPDRTASLVEARAVDDGAVVANLLQYAAHPTSVDEDVRIPHADYVLGAVDWLEREEGGVALYFNGPIADASPAGSRAGCRAEPDGTYGEVRCRGEGLARAAAALPSSTPLAPTLEVRHVTVTLPVTNPLFLGGGLAESFNRYYDFLDLPVRDVPTLGSLVEQGLVDLPQLTPTASTEVSRITIGGAASGLEIVTIPGEATGTLGRWIRGLAAPGAHVVLLGLTHNSFGYLLPEEEFSYVDESGDAGFLVPFTGYEEFVSLGPLSVPLLRADAYVPLFGADAARALPPAVTACGRSLNAAPCLVLVAAQRLHYAQEGLVGQCAAVGLPPDVCDRLRAYGDPNHG